MALENLDLSCVKGSEGVAFMTVDSYTHVEPVKMAEPHSVYGYIGAALAVTVGAVAMINKFYKRDRIFAEKIAYQQRKESRKNN
ncbi:MAG: hypothetical protein WCI72_00610 [archaeon]